MTQEEPGAVALIGAPAYSGVENDQPSGAGNAGRAAPADPTPTGEPEVTDVVIEDLLVEEISIDGMCGVY